MSENENNQNAEKVIDTEELKKETVNTVNQVKDTFKNVNIKQETKATTGFVKEMFKNPIGKLGEIAKDSGNKYFVTAVVLVVLWMIVELVGYILGRSKYLSFDFLRSIKLTLAPLVSVIVMSLIIFIMNKQSKKSLPVTLTTIVTAKIPVIIGSIAMLLTLFNSGALTITSRFASFCTVISIVLMYFGIKGLYEENDDTKMIKKFVIIQGIYYIAALIVSYLGISI